MLVRWLIFNLYNFMKHTIDASGKKLGRVASEAAKILVGKNSVEFARNKAPQVTVEVINAGKLSVTEAKLRDKTYKNYSGFPSGLNIQTLSKIKETKGMSEAIRRAVKGMLPKNKLQAIMIKNLKVTE